MKNIYYLIFASICIMIFFFIGWYNGSFRFAYPDFEKYPVKGIDISHYQKISDWEKIKMSGISFVYMKATEGDDWVDENLEENYRNARSINIPVGMYHFYSLRISGEAQLENIVRVSSGKIWDLPIAVDLEFVGNSKYRPTREEFHRELDILLVGIEKYQGRKPIIYTTYSFMEEYLGHEYSVYPLWIRDIFGFPNISNWNIWQYHDRGYIEGIEGFVDLNVLSGSLESFINK